MSSTTSDVLFSNENMARLITLNRPQKLNSLNTSMVEKITPRLIEYAKSNVNNVIILNSTSPKGLCAGGDVAECAKQILQQNPDYASDFFQKEYNLNFIISTYSKPYISLMDGITMGGGVGLSVHAPFRIATEKTKLAMPEMDIGFFPDVGTTFFLPRLDEKLGYYYALTGEVMSGLDSYLVGFATHYIPSERLPKLITRLSNLQPPVLNDEKVGELKNQQEFYQQINDILEEFTESKLPENAKFPFTKEELKVINEGFSKPSINEALSYFKGVNTEFSTKLFNKLSEKSPTSLNVAFELMNKGLENTIKDQLTLELITATNIMNQKLEVNDFVKGVKHKLIDKVKEPFFPQWTNPRTEAETLMKESIKTHKLPTPLINAYFNIDYKQYPYQFGLPRNNELKSFISGKETNKSYLPTPVELKHFFRKKYGNKVGLDLKLDSILELHGDSDSFQGKYVSWNE